MSINWDILISSGLGALIGSALTLIATYVAHYLDREKIKVNDEKLVFGFLQGIHDEIETLWDTYNGKVGMLLESLQPNEAFHYYWSVTQEYFTIYTENAHLIGRVDDHDLRKLIVSTYSRARGLIDSFRMNNEILRDYDQLIFLYQESGKEIHSLQADATIQSMVTYGASLKQSHLDVKADVSLLLRALNKKGVLSGGNNV